MTTTTTVAPLAATNTLAGFNDWGGRLHDMLIAVGLTQTSDSGQINWSTNTSFPTGQGQTTGYEIWRFNDALQSVAPIFIKISYGSAVATSTGVPVIPTTTLSVSTGSNGAGTLTNIWYGPIVMLTTTWTLSGPVVSTNTYVYSYAMYNATYGCAGLCYYPGFLCPHVTQMACSPICFFQIARTVDQVTGLPTAEGAVMHSLQQSATSGGGPTNMYVPTIISVNFAAWIGYAINSTVTNIPASITTTTQASGAQVFKQGYVMPRLGYLSQFCTVLGSEFPFGTLFYTTVLGTTQRQYIALGYRPFYSVGINSSEILTAAGQHLYSAMLWE